MRPIVIPAKISLQNQPNEVLQGRINEIRAGFQRLRHGEPEVSVVIPAYNEEESILKTLACLSASTTNRSVEVIVVNNNSKDNTSVIVESTGATCILETRQGITPARNAGLAAAHGKYILNADADTLYPPDWIERMVSPLDDPKNAAVYGRFAFIPTGKTGRPVYVVYEYMADFMRWYNKRFREEAVNMYGFNSAFRRTEGLKVDGFAHPPGANEDGWLALKLRNQGYGKLVYVTHPDAMVWTTDRRIQSDGGFTRGLIKRFKRILTKKGDVRTDL